MAMRGTGVALQRLDLGEVQRQAMQVQAEALTGVVRTAVPAGERVGWMVDEASVVVSTTDARAAAREFGRPGQPPRPVLGAACAEQGVPAAQRVGAAVVKAIRRAIEGR